MNSLLINVKSYTTKRYFIKLEVEPKGQYRVLWVDFKNNVEKTSSFCDYQTAALIFDDKVSLLEGH